MPEPGELNVLIVDDEPLARDLLKEIVAEVPCVGRITTCADGVEGIEAIRSEAPDLVLLDIRMPEVDGFDLIRAVGPDAMPEVVFVTGYEEYSLRAFEVHAVDYVLKPFDPMRIRDAVLRAAERVAAREVRSLSDRLEGVMDQLGHGASPSAHYASRLTVADGERFRFIDIDDVDWLEASRNYVTVHVAGERYQVRSSLKALLARLDPTRFLRIHRSTVVNLARVKEVQPWFGGDYIIILQDGEQLRVSRTHRASLLALMH